MLTGQDLKKIDGLFTKRIGEEFKRELDPIKKDIAGIKHELEPMKKDIVKIRKDQKTIVNFFDREYLDLRERVDVIERRLNIGL
ncbi:MAG: hypothetical protein ABH807_03105 [Candidatus Shapirobacteria bacterium]